MKAFTLAALASISSATLLISDLPGNTMEIGKEYEFTYTLDKEYTLEMELVQKGTEPNIAWTSVMTLFSDVKAKPCSGKYTAKPNDTWPTTENGGGQYALWISGTEKSGDGGYADLTKWFDIVEPEEGVLTRESQ